LISRSCISVWNKLIIPWLNLVSLLSKLRKRKIFEFKYIGIFKYLLFSSDVHVEGCKSSSNHWFCGLRHWNVLNFHCHYLPVLCVPLRNKGFQLCVFLLNESIFWSAVMQMAIFFSITVSFRKHFPLLNYNRCQTFLNEISMIMICQIEI
jgi:hypothetical protein